MSTAKDWLPQVPLQTASALIVIALDWVTFAVNLMLWFQGHALETPLFAAITALAIGVIEVRASPMHRRNAAIKTLVAAVAVAAPLPIWGTALGLVSLAWTVVQRIQQGQQRETSPRVLD